jgi:hypothetical protein
VLDVPTPEQVRAWTRVPASSISDEDLEQILDAELAIQARTCSLPEDPDPITGGEATYPAALSRAALRRCQRQIAARSLPLGILGADSTEFGPITLRAWDAEIVRLEASYRRVVVA